ncbi:MAG TPA: hypothetical protein VJW23_11930, partial [Propionibacteriaceae bacterium]|nr:hypothetical protein [Propionibacteriaceae bacterium]
KLPNTMTGSETLGTFKYEWYRLRAKIGMRGWKSASGRSTLGRLALAAIDVCSGWIGPGSGIGTGIGTGTGTGGRKMNGLRYKSPLTMMLSGPASGAERSTRSVPSKPNRLFDGQKFKT